MILDIKRKKKEKRIQLLGGLIGICVAVVSLFYFFHVEKSEAEKRMVEIVNYVKVQCSTYTHYNESSESKSLLRAIESARQMSTNIKIETENGGQLSEDFLKENLQTLWVDGIIVLDAEGKTDCEYSTDESLANEITEYLQKDIIMDFAGYEERSYSERFTREDGSFIDIAACARKDAPGIVAIYYYTSPEFARNYTLTIQGLLNGYSIQKDGTIIVADDGIVVASNDESLLGQNTADNEVVQAMKKHTDSQHIYHLKNEGTGCYGIMLKQRDYYIYAYLPDTHWDLIGSPGYVKRVMMNILSNAVKYNRANGQIYISCRELPSEQPEMTTIEFTCRDTGIGMTEAFQKQIFEPFAQEHTGSRTKFAGTGLGMPITKKLVEKMGGTISFESKEGAGTTFVIRVPFKIDPDVDEHKVQKDIPEKSIEGLHILLVEDNELNVEIAEFMLRNEGADVTKAWNGQKAVEIFEKGRPDEFDVILIDIMMPVMNGYEAARMIRSMDREDAKVIPIIAMTANAFTEDKLRTKEAGMNEHIAKPVDMKRLVKIICELAH
mgnify:CR=1 FL=1